MTSPKLVAELRREATREPRRVPRRLTAAVRSRDVPRARWLIVQWEPRVVRFIAQRTVEQSLREFVRRTVILGALNLTLQYRRRCLPPWICPVCAHDTGRHHFERRMSIAYTSGFHGRMTALWDCFEYGCRCRGEWPRGSPGPDQAMQDFITRAFRVAHRRAGIR